MMSVNVETGWTLFWAERIATPLPPERNELGAAFEGPEQVTIVAYGAADQVQHSVTGGDLVGLSVQNPRDNGGAPAVTRAPGAAATCPEQKGPQWSQKPQ